MKLSDYSKPILLKNDSVVGVLCIHGFTSTPQTLEYTAQKIHEAGFTVLSPILPGHGTSPKDLNNVTSYRVWLKGVEEAYHELSAQCSQVFVLGISMGGALALHLGLTFPEIKGLILINHGILMKFDLMRILLLPILRFFMPFSTAIGNDIKDPHAKELAYEKTPTNGAYHLTRLFRYIKSSLSLIEQPVMIFKSIEDHVLPLNNVHYTLKHISSKQKEVVWLDNSYHVASLDYDKDLIASKSIEFIQKYTQGAINE